LLRVIPDEPSILSLQRVKRLRNRRKTLNGPTIKSSHAKKSTHGFEIWGGGFLIVSTRSGNTLIPSAESECPKKEISHWARCSLSLFNVLSPTWQKFLSND
jgi:hypothetical protein